MYTDNDKGKSDGDDQKENATGCTKDRRLLWGLIRLNGEIVRHSSASIPLWLNCSQRPRRNLQLGKKTTSR